MINSNMTEHSEKHDKPDISRATVHLINGSKKMTHELYKDSKNVVYEAQDYLKKQSEILAAKIHNKPLISLLRAAGTGFILGSILGRRKP